MKLLPGNKKIVIATSALFLVAVSGVSVFALTKPDTVKPESKVAKIEQTQPTVDTSKPVQQETAAPTSVEQPTAQNAVSTPAPAPQPMYGEDPSSPGVFVVFDKTGVMDAAGIAQSDRQYVLEIAKSWTYKGPLDIETLCGALPKAKMSSFGADYEINPITQLKWCNSYAIGRYGSWQSAYDYWKTNHGF